MNRACLQKLALFAGRKVIGPALYPRIANPKMRLGYPVLLLILTPLWKQDFLKPLPLQVFYLIVSEKALNIVSININIIAIHGWRARFSTHVWGQCPRLHCLQCPWKSINASFDQAREPFHQMLLAETHGFQQLSIGARMNIPALAMHALTI